MSKGSRRFFRIDQHEYRNRGDNRSDNRTRYDNLSSYKQTDNRSGYNQFDSGLNRSNNRYDENQNREKRSNAGTRTRARGRGSLRGRGTRESSSGIGSAIYFD